MLTRQVPFPQFFRTASGMDEGCVRRQGNVIQLVDDQQEHSVELRLNTPDSGAEGFLRSLAPRRVGLGKILASRLVVLR
jgi:hypothetical protein